MALTPSERDRPDARAAYRPDVEPDVEELGSRGNGLVTVDPLDLSSIGVPEQADEFAELSGPPRKHEGPPRKHEGPPRKHEDPAEDRGGLRSRLGLEDLGVGRAPEMPPASHDLLVLPGTNVYTIPGTQLTFTSPQRPLKVAFLTSIRDVGKVEGVGSVVPHHDGSRYLTGTIEATLRAIQTDVLGPYADVVAIITDDLERDLVGSRYPSLPRPGAPWIHPEDLRNGSGELITSLTHNIASDFRILPLRKTKERAEWKLRFEQAVFEVMQQSGADVLISDHFMARIDYLIDPDFFPLTGRVLNTHPGITSASNPYRCLGRDPDEIAVLHANGQQIDPATGRLIAVDPHFWTGAAFHVVAPVIDEGTVLCDAELTRVAPTDGSREVVNNNYHTKNYVIVTGLRHYAAHLAESPSDLVSRKLQKISF